MATKQKPAIYWMVESLHYPKPNRENYKPQPAIGLHHAYCDCEICERFPENKHKRR